MFNLRLTCYELRTITAHMWYWCFFTFYLVLVTIIVTSSWNACGKTTAGIAVEEFGQEKEHGALIVETLMVLTSSEAMAAMTTSYSCDQEPELAEVYFGLMSTFVHSCPHVMNLHRSLSSSPKIVISTFALCRTFAAGIFYLLINTGLYWLIRRRNSSCSESWIQLLVVKSWLDVWLDLFVEPWLCGYRKL